MSWEDRNDAISDYNAELRGEGYDEGFEAGKIDSIKHLFICVNGCGDFKLTDMKPSKVPDDPTIVCPKCGCCQWYITPIK